ncbi:MAG: zinc transporter, family [Solirubrobacteraceae bacterium]|nr:zinc transporter, family [Solirubrobacteraceae bacterium]
MNDALLLTALAAGTVLATGVGALPVIALGELRARAAQGVLSGLAAGVMAVAAIVGLLLPAAEQGDVATVVAATVAGALALVLSRRLLNERAHRGGRSEAGARSLLVIGVLFAHSLPEGLAIGSAFASDKVGMSAFVIAAIAIQNVPEGTATAAAMAPAGYGHAKQFWGAVLTSAPQIPGALLAWIAVEQIHGLLPASFALAGGAMLALVVVDLLPDAWKHSSHGRVVAGTALGAALMLVIGLALEV